MARGHDCVEERRERAWERAGGEGGGGGEKDAGGCEGGFLEGPVGGCCVVVGGLAWEGEVRGERVVEEGALGVLVLRVLV